MTWPEAFAIVAAIALPLGCAPTPMHKAQIPVSAEAPEPPKRFTAEYVTSQVILITDHKTGFKYLHNNWNGGEFEQVAP